MYDFTSFIDSLSKGFSFFEDALKKVKDDFHIGKIEIKTNDFSKCLEYCFTRDYKKPYLISYMFNNFEYYLYSDNSNYNYNDNILNDANVLLKIFAIYHSNYILNLESRENGFTSIETKLPNAKGFIKNVSIILNKNKIIEYNSYFINIKGFGFVNRLYDYKIGDKAISCYANALRNFIDDSEVVGHLGGDNFVAFVKKEHHNDFVKLASSVNINIILDNKDININLIGVIGYVDIKDDNYNVRSLIPDSSIAFHYAKTTKKLVVKLTDDLLEMFISIKNIEHTFKDELKKGSFIIYYQPKFDSQTGKIVGVEALSRWINNGKIIPPSMFIPVLETNGEIIDLDLHILETLCKDISNFRNLGHDIVPASCNFSRKDFERDDLEDVIIGIIKKYNVKSEDIILEVTETMTLEENERIARFVATMWKNGIMTAIDDFGIGYSSLSALRDFKVNEIKIDSSFINRDVMSESDEIIIGSIIDMAKKLKIDVLCEGVETKKQVDLLAKLGCRRIQGYYYSEPLPRLEFEEMLKKNRLEHKD